MEFVTEFIFFLSFCFKYKCVPIFSAVMAVPFRKSFFFTVLFQKQCFSLRSKTENILNYCYSMVKYFIFTQNMAKKFICTLKCQISRKTFTLWNKFPPIEMPNSLKSLLNIKLFVNYFSRPTRRYLREKWNDRLIYAWELQIMWN